MSTTNLASPDKEHIRTFFNSIAGRYDFINTFLSFNLDDAWRGKACREVLDPAQESILDLGIGTGKFLKTFLDKKEFKRVCGVDFSEEMLVHARKALPPFVELEQADFHALPFKEASFDLVISSFTLRSVKNLPGFLKEVYRVLSDKGSVAFLCLTRPKNFMMKLFYYPYLKGYLPLMGRMISGNQNAYQFLSQSIQHFQDPEETVQEMQKCGFKNTVIKSMTFGAASLIIGRK